MPVLDRPPPSATSPACACRRTPPALPAAADFMVAPARHARAVRRVARTGYLVPANLEVALSDDFLQPGRLPDHADVFNTSVRVHRLPAADDHRAGARRPASRDPRAADVRSRSSTTWTRHPADRRGVPDRARPGERVAQPERVGRRARPSRSAVAQSVGLGSVARDLELGRVCRRRLPIRLEDRVDQDRGGEVDLPRAGAVPARARADPRGSESPRSRRLGRRPQGPAQVVGGQQVLDREVVLLGEPGDRLAGEGRAGGPRPGPSRPRRAAAAGRRRAASGSAGRSRASRATSFSAADPARGVPLGAAAVEALGGQQRGPVAGHRLRGGDDRGVGEDPARGDVALLGDLVAGLPQRAYGAERAAAADPVQPGGTAPRVDLRGTSSKPRRWSNSWRAHSSLPRPRARRRGRRAARRAPRRRGRRTPATARAAAGVDQSTAECSFASR